MTSQQTIHFVYEVLELHKKAILAPETAVSVAKELMNLEVQHNPVLEKLCSTTAMSVLGMNKKRG